MATAMTAPARVLPQPDLWSFSAPLTAAFGAFLGLIAGQAIGSSLIGILAGAVIGAAIAWMADQPLTDQRRLGRWVAIGGLAVLGLILGGLAGAVAGALIGAALGWFGYWVTSGEYRAGPPPYATSAQVLWYNAFRFICGLIFFFLIAPIVVVIPLSFNAQDFFTFTPEMLALKPEGYSLKHYRDFLGTEFLEGGGHLGRGLIIGLIVGAVWAGIRSFLAGKASAVGIIVPVIACGLLGLIIGKLWGVNGEWITPVKNSFIIAPIATLISVSLGTLAAIGLSQSHVPGRQAIMAILISPMIVPLIISATGMFFFYSAMGNWLEDNLGLSQDFVGYVKVVLAHAALGIPFVIITVTATLVGFDRSLTRASANLGAGPVRTFFKVQMPLIMPGVISGGLFAFITSFDEVVVVLFVGAAAQKTLPWQMFTGLREQISPTILAVATILVTFSIILLATVEILRRRSERLRGMSPG